MIIKQISFEATLDLRQKVLWPDKPQAFCIVDGDETATHYGIYADDRLVGVASIYENSGAVRLRKFAVDTQYQGLGFGTELFGHILRSVEKSGANLFWCDARQNAREFYERFGLRVEGDRFYKSNLPYYKMSLAFG